MKYGVRIILDQIEVEAGSEEEAIEIADNVYEGDAHEHLAYGLSPIGYEVEVLE